MYIIGEAGTWHAADGEQERMELAYELIDTAAECGVDAVKFQCFTEGELFCPMEGDEKRWPHWRRTFLEESQWSELKAYAEEKGIDFLLSAFQLETVDWCARMDLNLYKVASRARFTYPYDRAPGPFLISLGIKGQPYHGATELGLKIDVGYLQCISEYPVPLARARWTEENSLEERGFEIGLSDHSGFIWPAIDALARGCPIIEVHFSTTRRPPNPDTKISLYPRHLELICAARDAFREMRQD